ncbi:hypothetical protein [Phenylobacterium deserti]|uniref:Uncharacterized protein n=1 Tax=Phenylobacterium deserti TaxID=1914756 RepID=A0A328APA3_9CAUL|nr:hypothetical protein [Phenylobacterium deserti]RAK56417.1 hypothetical protein DJ018_00040 [Phenylobacterium deserti]
MGSTADEVTVISRISNGNALRPSDAWVAEQRRYTTSLGRIPDGKEPYVPGPVVRDHRWIDGRTCPALLTALRDVTALPPVSFGGPDGVGGGSFATDTFMTTLRGPAPYGVPADEIRRSDYGGPVARWWQRTEEALEPCWTPKKPSHQGAVIEEYLSSAAAADAWARRRPEDGPPSHER